ncbi:DUF559 domain-containing protein [Euzebya tangerina]|uniref:DUF559 domain-containing protein n=1 Tax=Euzebya tangerina TaxID=591198 RepID=UPI000E310190|nr:DUF559 domain-containing protein [Euzebya tangerina]
MIPKHVIDAFKADPGRILSAAQLRRVGVNRLVAASWAHDGDTERLLHGIYRLAQGRRPPDQCLHVPVRYLSQRAVEGKDAVAITGGAALALFDAAGFTLPMRPLVLVDRSRSPRTAPEVYRPRRVRMDDVDVWRVRGLPLASPARALADAALPGQLSDPAVRSAVDSLRSARVLRLEEAVEHWRSLPGAGAKRLLDFWSSGAFNQESEGERRLFREVFEPFPPLPDCQVTVHGKLRVDFVFLSAGLIIEYDGSPHDGSADRDASRRYALERLGYRVIVVTKSMLQDPAGLAEFIHGVRRWREQQILKGELVCPALPASELRRTDLHTLAPTG